MNYSKIKQVIKNNNLGKASFEVDTSRLCSIRSGGKVPALVTVNTQAELINLLTLLNSEGIRYFIIGGGTNILFKHDIPDLVLIRPGKAMGGVTVYPDGRIGAGSAALTAVLVKKAAEAGMDLTFLAGIPGTVGGAISGNSGSSDKWICDSIISLRYILRDKSGFGLVECSKDQIDSGYRFFNVPGLVAIVSVVMRPDISKPEDLADKIKENMEARKKSQPLEAKTSGCFFKNPGNKSKPAGELIDGCGLKGFAYGGARVSAVHANFIENFSNASPNDIVVLSKIMIDRVAEKYGITLDYEVELVGEEYGL